MTAHSTLVPAWACALGAVALTLPWALVFAFAPKQALLQIPGLGPFLLKLRAQCGLTLCALLFHLAQEPKKTIFTPRSALQRTLVHALEVVGLHHQLDVLLLGQRDELAGKRR